jgi:NAD+ synthase
MARIQAVRYKVDLPNYGVFDEKRVFAVGPLPGPLSFAACASACRSARTSGSTRSARCLAETGAEILVVPNGSPYSREVYDERAHCRWRSPASTESGLPMVYVNQVRRPGRAGLRRCLLRPQCRPHARLPAAAVRARASPPSTWQTDAELGWRCTDGTFAALTGLEEANWRACVLGLRDYVNKNGFPGVVLGLSGGIDSAICAAMAVDALGASRVHCVMLPYRFTSEREPQGRGACAEALGVRYDVVPIAAAVEGPFEASLSPVFGPRTATSPRRTSRAGPRHAPHGDLEQVRRRWSSPPATSRDVGRLRHPLRRHERRLQPDQGPLQDRGLPLCALRNRWKPAGAWGRTAR